MKILFFSSKDVCKHIKGKNNPCDTQKVDFYEIGGVGYPNFFFFFTSNGVDSYS